MPGGWGRRPKGDAPRSEAGALGARPGTPGLDPSHPRFVTLHGPTLNQARLSPPEANALGIARGNDTTGRRFFPKGGRPRRRLHYGCNIGFPVSKGRSALSFTKSNACNLMASHEAPADKAPSTGRVSGMSRSGRSCRSSDASRLASVANQRSSQCQEMEKMRKRSQSRISASVTGTGLKHDWRFPDRGKRNRY